MSDDENVKTEAIDMSEVLAQYGVGGLPGQSGQGSGGPGNPGPPPRPGNPGPPGGPQGPPMGGMGPQGPMGMGPQGPGPQRTGPQGPGPQGPGTGGPGGPPQSPQGGPQNQGGEGFVASHAPYAQPGAMHPGQGPQGGWGPNMQPGMTPSQAYAAQGAGEGKRLVVMSIGMIFAMAGAAMHAINFADRSPDLDMALLSAAIGGFGLILAGAGVLRAGKHTSGFAAVAGIFGLLGGAWHAGGIVLFTDSSGSDALFLLGSGFAAGAFPVLMFGIWATLSRKALGGLGMAAGILGILAGLAGTAFWVGVTVEVLKTTHVSEAVPGVIGGLALPCLLLALRGFGKTKPQAQG